MTSKILKLIVWVVIVLFVAWGSYKIYTAPKIPESEIVSSSGLHWHAHLSIVISGKEESIPADIGVTGKTGAGGDPIELHTHDTSGVIHAEFEGLVKKDQLQLKNFFKLWKKDFSKDSILGNKAGDGHTIKMLVNGQPNEEFENYHITNVGTWSAGESERIDDIKIIYE